MNLEQEINMEIPFVVNHQTFGDHRGNFCSVKTNMIYDQRLDKNWIQVKNYRKAKIQKDFIPKYFCCLITTNRRIQIDEEIFWDWEDDELHTNNWHI